MPSFKNFIERDQADQVAVNFQPPSIEHRVQAKGLSFLEKERKPGEFRVDKVVAEYVGLDQIEREAQQKEIAERALEMSKEIQEQAFQEAYKLGLEEGRQTAFDEEKARIQDRLTRIESLITSLKAVRTRALKKTENEIVDLCFHVAQRMAFKEITEDRNYIKGLIAKVLESLQSDEKMIIRLSSVDHQWFEENRSEFFKDLELTESTRIESDDQMLSGGVVIETEFGVVDASLEQRIAKVESILKGQG